MQSLGAQSKTTFLNTCDDDLNLEFTAAADVKAGQAVKLDADGKIRPWVKTDALNKNIGVCVTSAATGDTVTVYTRGFAVIWALSLGSTLDAGPVVQGTYDSSTDAGGGRIGYNAYEAPGANAANAWNLTPAAAAGTLINVLIAN